MDALEQPRTIVYWCKKWPIVFISVNMCTFVCLVRNNHQSRTTLCYAFRFSFHSQTSFHTKSIQRNGRWIMFSLGLGVCGSVYPRVWVNLIYSIGNSNRILVAYYTITSHLTHTTFLPHAHHHGCIQRIERNYVYLFRLIATVGNAS